jgi:hypothetical protein
MSNDDVNEVVVCGGKVCDDGDGVLVVVKVVIEIRIGNRLISLFSAFFLSSLFCYKLMLIKKR